MTASESAFEFELSRRKLLAAAGLGGGAAMAVAAAGAASADAAADPVLDPVTTPPVAGLHLQFGADASSQMVVSWLTLQPVRRPRVLLGRIDGKLEQVIAADRCPCGFARTHGLGCAKSTLVLFGLGIRLILKSAHAGFRKVYTQFQDLIPHVRMSREV